MEQCCHVDNGSEIEVDVSPFTVFSDENEKLEERVPLSDKRSPSAFGTQGNFMVRNHYTGIFSELRQLKELIVRQVVSYTVRYVNVTTE